MTRQRPVPRTLSDILKRLQKPSGNPKDLMSPEALSALKAPITAPESLFKNVKARPKNAGELQAESTRQRIQKEGFTSPSALFGSKALAEPGQLLAKPYELDFEPTQPQEPIILVPLDEVNPLKETPHISFVEENAAEDEISDA